MSEQHPASDSGSGGILFKLGLVVLSIGLCALSMLVMRQARLQAAHEVTQTQLRIQRADEQLWKMRADIAGLANPSRIRELAGNLGPMHALINPVDASPSPSLNAAIPMVEQIEPIKLPLKTDAKPSKSAGAKPAEVKNAAAKGADKPAPKPSDKPQPSTDRKSGGSPVPNAAPKSAPKPDTKAKPRPSSPSPTGLAAIPAPKVRELDR